MTSTRVGQTVAILTVVMTGACCGPASPGATCAEEIEGATVAGDQDFSPVSGSAEEEMSSTLFWQALEIDADWNEFYPTLSNLIEGADVVAVGTVVAIGKRGTLQGDAREDAISEGLFSVRVERGWRGVSSGETFQFDLVLGLPFESLEGLALPQEPVLVLARRRQDFTANFRLVNGFGLWTSTERAQLDAPVNPYPPSEGVYAAELEAYPSIDELVELVEATLPSDP